MPITVVLASGFDGQDVELIADGVSHVVEDVTTSLVDGTAAEIDVQAAGEVEVTARIVRGLGAKAQPQPDDVLPEHHPGQADEAGPGDDEPLARFTVPKGAALVLTYDERGLSGAVHTEPVSE